LHGQGSNLDSQHLQIASDFYSSSQWFQDPSCGTVVYTDEHPSNWRAV